MILVSNHLGSCNSWVKMSGYQLVSINVVELAIDIILSSIILKE